MRSEFRLSVGSPRGAALLRPSLATDAEFRSPVGAGLRPGQRKLLSAHRNHFL